MKINTILCKLIPMSENITCIIQLRNYKMIVMSTNKESSIINKPFTNFK